MKNILHIKKKIDENKAKDRENRGKLFLEEYKALSLKYNMDIMASLAITERGILPTLKITDKIEIPQAPEVKQA